MKKKFIAALATFTFVVAGPDVASSPAQDFTDGPIGEVSSISEGGVFAGSDFAGSGFGQPPNAVYTPSGEAIEVFNPNVPTIGPAASTPVTPGDDWITEDGRINLQRGNRQSPEEALWAPDDASGNGWSDGQMGLQAGVDWLFFSRGVNGGSDFAFNDAGQSFSNADIDLDTESTPRFRLGIASEYGTGYEFVGYDFNQFSGSLALTGEGITTVFFAGVPSEPAESYTATYESRIKSYELNVWSRRSENLRVGYGLRHFSIDETYDITEGTDGSSATATPAGGAGGGSSGFFSETDNDLFGGQIMLELYRRVTPSTYLEGGVRGMLFNNSADIDVETASREIGGDDSFVSGGVGFNGGLSYRPFRGFNLRAGYEGVFLGGIASGPAQSENTTSDQFFGPLNPIGDGLYFGGGYVGCTVTF